jgi:mannose-1-phosphate guanylyltransferase
MAGGPGKRFWPLSTSRRPKPFLHLVGNETLLQACYRRLRSFLPAERIVVISSRAHLDLVEAQLPELPPANRIGEAEGRDSAACVGLGTALVASRDPEGVMAALPADQIIHPTGAFAGSIEALAEATSAESCLGTLGIEPAEPATRFGYVEVGEPAGTYGGLSVLRVAGFKEKPGKEEAVRYVDSGRYLWNAGIFVAPVRVLKHEIQKRFPPLGSCLEAFEKGFAAGEDPGDLTGRLYGAVPRTSFDYAVVEKLDRVLTLKAPFAWDDVGDWRALRRHLAADADGNLAVGVHAARDTRNCVVFAPDSVVATLGLEDVVVARAGKAILVARADRLDELKALVADLEGREAGEEVL